MCRDTSELFINSLFVPHYNRTITTLIVTLISHTCGTKFVGIIIVTGVKYKFFIKNI